MVQQIKPIFVYTDGSCHGNPGPGGWAAVFKEGGEENGALRQVTGHLEHTTNNRMEMMAVIGALRLMPKGSGVVIHTDSKLIADGFNQGWTKNWQQNGWHTAKGGDVQNREL